MIPDTQATFARRGRVRVATTVALLVALLLTVVGSIVVGQYQVPVGSLLHILGQGPVSGDIANSVVWNIRLPRVIAGLAVGAALAVAGTLMQAVFANPLAEPSVIGVTSGAGVGAALAIVFSWSFLGTTTVAFAAFVTALIATVLVYSLAKGQGRVRVVNLILTGIAVNAVCGAIISLLIYLAPTAAREHIIFWQMGSLNGTQWKHVVVVVPLTCIGLAAAGWLARRVDVLALGDQAAGHVGLNVGRVRAATIITATILTAAAVSYAGLIGFVGLIVPHLLRTVLGPANRVLIPLSALAGAVLIELSDVVARTVIAFADLPIGIFTALVGGPTFFYLLRRMMRKGQH